MAVMSTGQAITESLIAHGVEVIFGIPGAHMYDFNDALARRREQIRFIVTRHEQGAGYMAYGYAKSTGRVGAYSVVPGPGLLNSAAALCTAYGATAPVLCITGNVMSHLIGRGRGQLHELPDQLALLRGLTKWAQRIDHPTEAPRVMAEAFRQLSSGRVRPVAVEAPWNVFGMRAEVAPLAPLAPDAPPAPDPDSVVAAAKLIAAAKRPLITVGAGALHAGEAVLALARLLQAPVTAHRSGRGIVSDESPYGMRSVAAHEYWKDADLLIGIGTRLELQHFRWRSVPSGVRVVRLDIDPTEMVRLPADVGIVADSAAGTAALIEALEPLVGKRASREQEFNGIKARADAAIERVQPQMSYLQAIRRVLPRSGFFVEEISQAGFTARFGFPVYAPRQYVTGGYQDNLGFGFNTALGVKVAHPREAVVSITGDGGFLFGCQELATAVQHGIALVTIVFNNESFGNVRRDQLEQYQGRLLGADLRNPDFVRLAQSFGALALRALSPQDLEGKLESALEAAVPAVIEVPIERGTEVSPWPFTLPAPQRA
ncbi:MAG TPA: thiamine pyrophosphate-dependent enzyme [Steroidobacteraceae bacterium]|nr:thiamine pyrophosphate-dependent enzyme [Steroidobacteraceae bacterium]